jgi:hypothetical protein
VLPPRALIIIIIIIIIITIIIITPWLQSASKLYQPSDRRLSAKLVPTFEERGVSSGQRGGSPTTVISVSRPQLLLIVSSSSSNVRTNEAEWTPVQIN